MAAAFLYPSHATAQCVSDPFTPTALPFDADYLFGGLDQSLAGQFAAWLTRWQQENTADPTPLFVGEDNSQNGINDDDHLELLAAILKGDPAATVLSGITPANINAIRASYTANRAKVRPDLTLTIIFVTVNIIDEINADDPDFGASLQDLVAAYMTIGDAESVAYIRGLLITLGEIFIEIGVANGDIPAIVEGLTKTTLRNTVNANFVATRYECYGDAPGAAKPNLLGDSGNIDGNGQTNEAEYSAAGGDRQAWLIAKGVAQPPLQFVVPPASVDTLAGEPASLTADIAGGTGAPITYDWKRVDASTGNTAPASSAFPLDFDYPLPADAGQYQLFICDGTWIRASLPVTLSVTPAPFAITQQPQPATRSIGGSVTFTVSVRGGEQLPGYSWYFGQTAETLQPIPNANGNTLLLENLAALDAGLYQCRITGGPANAPVTLISNAASLVVDELLDETAPDLSLIGANPLLIECGSEFSDPGATANDETDGIITDSIQVSGAVIVGTPGQYTLTYSVSDAAGNLATASRTVQVADALSPALTLIGPNPQVLACKATFVELGATADDSCAGELTGQVQITGTVNTNSPGSYTRTYTVTDPSGNAATLTRTVQVVDNTAPVLTRIGASSISLACGGIVNDPGVVATDACAGNLTSIIQVSGELDPGTPGEYTRTYSVSDPFGNISSTTRTFIVTDAIPPVLTLVGASPLTVSCGTALADPGATAVDACDGVLTQSVQASGDVNTEVPGDYQRIYTVSDAAGNTSQVSRIVSVADTTPPVITLTGAEIVSVPCKGVYTEAGATAQDACDGDAISVQISGNIDTTTPGSYTRTYSATDSSGNTATAARTVNVVDDVPPIPSLNGAANLEIVCGNSYTEPGASANDACDGAITSYSVQGTVNTGLPGEYTLVYSLTDASGNVSSLTRTVTVNPGAPILTIDSAATITLECGDQFVPPAYSAEAPCLGDVTQEAVTVEGLDAVDPGQPGEYPVTYYVQDFQGNLASEFTKTVLVVDTRAPVLSLAGPQQVAVACGASYIDPGAAAIDACDRDLTSEITVTGQVDTGVPGEYTLNFAVEDTFGNQATRTRTINVVGELAPKLELLGEAAVSISCGDTYSDAGFTATDSCGAIADARVQLSGQVETGRPGVYELTYVLPAESGGPALATRTVTVLPDCAINFTLQPNSQDLYEGQRAIFNIAALGGSAALTYQWFFEETPIEGAKASVLAIDAVTLDDAGDYYCVAGDGFTTANSARASLRVFQRPAAGQQSADTNGDWSISLSELLRLIQFYNTGAFSCLEGSEDGYTPGPGDQQCAPHSTDYNPQDWALSLSELLRTIQFYNTPGSNYQIDPTTEDGFAPGAG